MLRSGWRGKRESGYPNKPTERFQHFGQPVHHRAGLFLLARAHLPQPNRVWCCLCCGWGDQRSFSGFLGAKARRFRRVQYPVATNQKVGSSTLSGRTTF